MKTGESDASPRESGSKDVLGRLRRDLGTVESYAALLGIYASRGLEGAVGWGQASIHAAFIVFISMFVNSIARLVMQVRAGTHVTQQKPTIEIPAKSSTESTKLAA